MKTKTVLLGDVYNEVFITLSETENGDVAKTYTCITNKQVDFYSLILTDDCSEYIFSGFKLIKKFKDKYLVINTFRLQHTTLNDIVYKYINWYNKTPHFKF